MPSFVRRNNSTTLSKFHIWMTLIFVELLSSEFSKRASRQGCSQRRRFHIESSFVSCKKYRNALILFWNMFISNVNISYQRPYAFTYRIETFTQSNFLLSMSMMHLRLTLIRERGTLWRIRDEFTYTRRCMESTDNSGRALGANDVFTAFMILTGGYVLSITFLLLEKLVCLNPISYIQ